MWTSEPNEVILYDASELGNRMIEAYQDELYGATQAYLIMVEAKLSNNEKRVLWGYLYDYPSLRTAIKILEK